MKRLIGATALVFISVIAFAQQPATAQVYTRRGLELVGLAPDEIQEVLRIDQDAGVEIRRYRANQEIKKAELARLLLDEAPNMRLVERNLREAADIEVEIRLVEIVPIRLAQVRLDPRVSARFCKSFCRLAIPLGRQFSAHSRNPPWAGIGG